METVTNGQMNNMRYYIGIRGNTIMTNSNQVIASCKINNIGHNDYDQAGIYYLSSRSEESQQ